MTNKKGFTLIELLVVIAIIGILSAIGLVSLGGAREKARDAQRKTDVATMRTALSLYYDDHNSQYPTQGGTTAGAAVDASGNFKTEMVTNGKYMATYPSAQTGDATNCGNAAKYFYATEKSGATNDASQFAIVAQLETSACKISWVANSTVATQVNNTTANTIAAGSKCANTPTTDLCGALTTSSNI